MFGNNQSDQNTQDTAQDDNSSTNPAMRPGDEPFPSTPLPQDVTAPTVVPTTAPAASESEDTPNLGSANTDSSSNGAQIAAVEPVVADDATSVGESGGSDDLTSLKQQALQQLSPLVGHLDQTPEEKFKTTMMMIQASDDQNLVKTAYEAAQQITDEKAKAQALLDVINEINYFTQQKS